MLISRQNLTIIIVCFKSENVIHNCIQSIDSSIKILIVDNSNNKEFKEKIEKQYNNVECILSSSNLGMGSGNNLGIKEVSTDFAFIINPDVILEKNTLDKIIEASQLIESFSVIAPMSNDDKYLNFKRLNGDNNINDKNLPFKVKSVDGYAMLLNLKKLKNLKGFNFFDENFFMYLENDDMCKRLIDLKENIYVIPTSKINHLGGKAVDEIYSYEIELSRNWHWIWSKFYFNKKHYGTLNALLNGFPNFFSSILKFILYTILNNDKKRNIYLKRMLGFLNAVFGKPSSYRPKI